jgi:outer membrane protein OmpA-like peptidoglycan-associated protein
MLSVGSGGNDDGDPVQSVSERDPVEPCPAAPFPSQGGARIPLQDGTVITTAWGIKYEDVESRISLEAATPVSISMSNTTGAYKRDDGQEARPSSHRDTVCNADIASAGTYITVVGTHIPHLIHGVTRLRLSDKSFNEVKSSGKTNLEYLDFMQAAGDAEKPIHDAGLLTRVEPQDVPYPMIVNDERVTLPAIHIAGVTDPTGKDPRPKKNRPNHAAADLYVLDDPLDPLVLLWKEKDPALHDGKFRVEVVKIDFKTTRPVNIVEKQLTEQKRAVTYGIYFDFSKDTLKPESETVLKQIVQAMTDNPTWKLTVEGHTDNIGEDTYNLDLSKRRAAAVKQALVTRYHISPDRLSTEGFGASRPVESNDTLEGRARNRRVELTRE